MTKKAFPAIILGLGCIITMLTMQYRALQAPGAKEHLAATFREMPALGFYSIFIPSLILMLGTMYALVSHKKWAEASTRTTSFSAKQTASSLWHVEGAPMKSDDWAVVYFKHATFGGKTFMLAVRPGHPDMSVFRQLKVGDRVEFTALTNCLECALEHELCGYLRIVTVS